MAREEKPRVENVFVAESGLAGREAVPHLRDGYAILGFYMKPVNWNFMMSTYLEEE